MDQPITTLELFDETQLGPGHELLLPADVQQHRFTLEQVKLNTERFKSICAAIAEGVGIRRICRAWKVSPNVVYKVMEQEGLSVETEKKQLLGKVTLAAHLLTERMIEEVDKVPAGQIGLNAGIFLTKRAELLGEPSFVVEHRHTHELSAERLLREIADFKRGAIDCESTVLIAQPAQIVATAAPASTLEAAPAAPIAISEPPPAPGQDTGGGGRATSRGGESSMH